MLEFLEQEGVRIIRTPFRGTQLRRLRGAVRSVDQGGVPRSRQPAGGTASSPDVAEFVAHYHGERNHRGIGKARLIQPVRQASGQGPVRRRLRIGGMLNYYYRAA